MTVIPDVAQALIEVELKLLTYSARYSVPKDKRVEIYAALGPSSVMDEKMLDEARKKKVLLTLSAADRVRARIALITAIKVEKLWQQACLETDANFSEHQDQAEINQNEVEYLAQRKQKPIEHISVYKVPRAFVPSHILTMTELALTGEINDIAAFRYEANEWWGIYGRPEEMEREFFIKWAAQDALYEAIGWIRHNSDPPAENALYAFAGVFEGKGFHNRLWTIDEKKQQEFWVWWLTEAIPQAVMQENNS